MKSLPSALDLKKGASFYHSSSFTASLWRDVTLTMGKSEVEMIHYTTYFAGPCLVTLPAMSGAGGEWKGRPGWGLG